MGVTGDLLEGSRQRLLLKACLAVPPASPPMDRLYGRGQEAGEWTEQPQSCLVLRSTAQGGESERGCHLILEHAVLFLTSDSGPLCTGSRISALGPAADRVKPAHQDCSKARSAFPVRGKPHMSEITWPTPILQGLST